MGWDGFGGELHLNAIKYLQGFGVFHSIELEKEDLQKFVRRDFSALYIFDDDVVECLECDEGAVCEDGWMDGCI